jgi:photosystem II stability/assembly factor-like uncharacterized protein
MMRKFRLFFALLLIFAINISMAFADTEGKISLPFGGQLRQFNFYGLTSTDADNVWCVGAFGAIAHSGDGGKVWKLQESTVLSELYDVAFAGDKTGWVVGRHGVILKTIDGGNLWVRQESNVETALFGVSFIDSNTGWAVGEINTILHTDNGGETWVTQGEENDRILNQVVFVDSNTGWAVGEYGTIIHTTDGGKQWSPQVNPKGTDILYGACFTDQNYGVAVGIGGYTIATEDGGATWTILDSAVDEALYGIHIVGQKAWTVGMKGLYATSQDAGRTWTDKTGSLHCFIWIYRIYFSNENNGWACGANGTILYTGDGGNSWRLPEKLILK